MCKDDTDADLLVSSNRSQASGLPITWGAIPIGAPTVHDENIGVLYLDDPLSTVRLP